jgi:hypothetical protein
MGETTSEAAANRSTSARLMGVSGKRKEHVRTKAKDSCRQVIDAELDGVTEGGIPITTWHWATSSRGCLAAGI